MINEEDQTVSEAIETVFPLWAEEAILFWNRICIPLAYKDIVSFLVDDIMKMIESLLGTDVGTLSIHWPSNDFAAIWNLNWRHDDLAIHSQWNSVVGFTEGLLAERPTVEIKRLILSLNGKSSSGFYLKPFRMRGTLKIICQIWQGFATFTRPF